MELKELTNKQKEKADKVISLLIELKKMGVRFIIFMKRTNFAWPRFNSPYSFDEKIRIFPNNLLDDALVSKPASRFQERLCGGVCPSAYRYLRGAARCAHGRRAYGRAYRGDSIAYRCAEVRL